MEVKMEVINGTLYFLHILVNQASNGRTSHHTTAYKPKKLRPLKQKECQLVNK